MALTSKINVSIAATLTSALDLTTVTAPVSAGFQLALASGTGAGQADKIWSDRRTLAASATEDLDLAGVLTDPFGAAITFVKLKALYVVAATGNTNNVVLGNATSNAWAALLGATGTAVLRPGASLLVTAGAADATGYAVTAGTGDLLKVANSAGSTGVTYEIVVIGTSA